MTEQFDIINTFIVPLFEQEFYKCQKHLDETLAYRRSGLDLQGLEHSGASIESTQKAYEKDIEARQAAILSSVQQALSTVKNELSQKTAQDIKELAKKRLSSHIQEFEKKLREHASQLGVGQFDGLELGADRILAGLDAKLEILLRTAVTAMETPEPTPLSTSEGMHRIFLCHASEDKPQVREVYQRLKSEGFQPWLDEEDLLPGQEWDREIRLALKESDFILIFFSQNSVVKRGYVQREMKLALDVWEEIPEGTIFAIPIRLDDCEIPEQFRKFQWVNLFD